jgi:hypothetical protein
MAMMAMTISNSIKVKAALGASFVAFVAINTFGTRGEKFTPLLSAVRTPAQAFSCLLGRQSVRW